jgi:hypothetical protein
MRSDGALPARALPMTRVMMGRREHEAAGQPRDRRAWERQRPYVHPLHHHERLQNLSPLYVEETRIPVDGVRIHVEDRPGRICDQVGQ